MKHIAAALLLSLAGKDINDKNINETLASAGIKPNAVVVALIIAACKGKSPTQIIAEGASKLSSAVAVAATAVVEKKEEKKEAPKKKEEPKVEEEDIGFGDLF